MRCVLAVLAIGLCGTLSMALPAGAQSWPPKTIRIIIPFPPGGTTDLIARRAQPMLERNLKVSILIENRAGASGAIGTQAAVTSPPDGATFVLVFDTHGANPSLLPNLPFDTLKDLAPVMLIGTSPMIVTAHQSAPYQSFAEVIAAAKAKPEAVAYGTIGAGSLAHLAMSQIGNALNVKLTHVPYKGWRRPPPSASRNCRTRRPSAKRVLQASMRWRGGACSRRRKRPRRSSRG
jgi:tripartite-type tricarboxylate transporter receptor subunit TctC